MNKYYLFLVICTLLSCSGSTTEGTEDGPPISEDEARALEAGDMIQTITVLPEGIKASGNQFITGRKWKDSNGQNIILFTFSEEAEKINEDESGITRTLFAEHFTRKTESQNYHLLYQVKDAETACAFDNMLYLEEESISITDLNEDQYKEASFVYTMGCVSDVSPYPMKLVLLEKGKQYTVTGEIRFEQQLRAELGEEATLPKSTDKNFDSVFDQAPDKFRTFANELWDSHEMK